MAHVTGAALSQDLVRELVYRYFRSGMSYEAIAQSVGVDVRTVTRYNEKLWPLMLALNAGVMTLLEEQFRLAGVIP